MLSYTTTPFCFPFALIIDWQCHEYKYIIVILFMTKSYYSKQDLPISTETELISVR